MEKMMEYAKQAFQKHKEIEIAYTLKQRNNNEEVSEEKYKEALEKYQSVIRLSIEQVTLDQGPTGAKEENKAITNEKVE